MAIPVLITLFLLLALNLAQTSISSPVQDPELVVQEVHKYDTETIFEYIVNIYIYIYIYNVSVIF
jgi:hypothetical protein